MIVVVDTTPLNYLIQMDQVDVLQTLYQRLIVPEEVILEMRAAGAPGVVSEWALSPPEWIRIVGTEEADETLSKQLGSGERAAINIALALNANVLLMDDQPGRRAAEERGLFVSGTLSVILQASRRGLLDFESAMRTLKSLGFRMSKEVEDTMRTLARRTK